MSETDEITRQREVIRRLNGQCDHLGIRLGEVIAERDRLRAEVEALRGAALTKREACADLTVNDLYDVLGKWVRGGLGTAPVALNADGGVGPCDGVSFSDGTLWLEDFVR